MRIKYTSRENNMDVHSLRISKVFYNGGDVQYLLPHFQREYAWERENWSILLDDIFNIYDAYEPDDPPEHFLGAIVVISDGRRSGTIPAFKLVDGQQRLITISLILCALGRIVEDVDQDLHKKILKLITNLDEKGYLHYKVVPTTKYGDREAYINIISGNEITEQTESKIPSAFEFIYKQLKTKITNGALEAQKLFIVLSNCLHVVFIDLDQRERPYEIFESLNAKGKPLTQPDLVRNYIAMRLPESKQEEVFDLYWADIEAILQERRTVARIGEMTAFLRHYLAYHTGILFNKGHVYARFRDRIEKQFPSTDEFIDEIKNIRRFAGYYNNLLRPEYEKAPQIRTALHRLNILESSTAYPFLMAVYEGNFKNDITSSDMLEGLQILEAYMVRRYLAGEPTNYLNKMFPTLWREVNTGNFVDSLRQVLSTKNHPSDVRLQNILKTSQVYDQRRNERLCLILETVNQYLSLGSGGHTVLDSKPTIEHIMPQKLDQTWKAELGFNWEEIYREYLHTLGNLTLVTQKWNSELSNAPFVTKQRKLSQHALLLNSTYFGQAIEKWDDGAILDRAQWLTDHIIQIWPSLGEQNIEIRSGQKPRLLTILGEAYEVKHWRDVAFYAAESVAYLVNNFDEIAETMQSAFSRTPFSRTRQLSNGWWLNTNLRSETIPNFCNQMFRLAELSEDDWDIQFE